MFRTPWLLTLSLLAAVAHAQPAAQAQASVRLQLVVPPVLRVSLAPPDANGEQTLVMASNLPQGSCITLRPVQAEPVFERPAAPLSWQGGAGLTLTELAGGYRLCSHRPGQHRVVLLPAAGSPALWADMHSL